MVLKCSLIISHYFEYLFTQYSTHLSVIMGGLGKGKTIDSKIYEKMLYLAKILISNVTYLRIYYNNIMAELS